MDKKHVLATQKGGPAPSRPSSGLGLFPGNPCRNVECWTGCDLCFTVNLWAQLVLGSCTCKQPEVAQKQKWHQDLCWQGPGPKARVWKETAAAPVLPCWTPVLPLLLFDVFPSSFVAKVAAPAMVICFFQRNKVCFYFMLLTCACLVFLGLCPLVSTGCCHPEKPAVYHHL